MLTRKEMLDNARFWAAEAAHLRASRVPMRYVRIAQDNAVSWWLKAQEAAE